MVRHPAVRHLIPARELGHRRPVRMVHIRHLVQIQIHGHIIMVRHPAVRHLIPERELGHRRMT